MERLQELLSRITELSGDELIELCHLIVAQVEELNEDDGAVPYEELASLAAAADSLRKEQKRRSNRARRVHDARHALPTFRAASQGGRAVVPADRRTRRPHGLRPAASGPLPVVMIAHDTKAWDSAPTSTTANR
jgi:hypothetical protein